MIKLMLIASMTINLIIFSINGAQADDRIKHYEAFKPKNNKQAIEGLQQYSIKINEIIAHDKELNQQDLEAIHELTYGLEASHEFLMQDKDDAKKLGLFDIISLGKAIKKLHNVSEDHNIDETLVAYQQLKEQIKINHILEK